jgi:hypothetical protein
MVMAMNMTPITLFVLGAMIGSAIQCAIRAWRPSKTLAWSAFIVAFAQLGVVAILPKESEVAFVLTTAQLIVGIVFGIPWFRFVRTK